LQHLLSYRRDEVIVAADERQGIFGGTFYGLAIGYMAGGTINVVAPSPAVDPVEAAALLHDLPLDTLPDSAPFAAISWMPYRANSLFVGRADALQLIAAHFQTGAVDGSHIVALTGTGGLGKTNLATEFVHRYGRYFAGGIFWLNCADPRGVPSEIVACGSRGLVSWRPEYNSLTLGEQVQLVLAAWQQPLPRLLIFDNCEDMAVLAHFCPPTGGSRVLITCRRATWDPSLGVKSSCRSTCCHG
jgi:hypothetical protein